MIQQLQDNNFSIWCDFVQKDFLRSEFKDLIREGKINGATSNPSIFAKAFSSDEYKPLIKALQDKSGKEIYETLALEDIALAAKLLQGLHTKNDNNGFISIEVDPALANDTKATIDEGKRLYDTLAFPNIMIKVPATDAGFEAMRVLSQEGINVNATLVFSPTQAMQCLEAFSNQNSKSVISVFVSRFDRLINDTLEQNSYETNKFGIVNAQYIYTLVQNANLANTRTLFASTSMKDTTCPKDYYITSLLHPNSINTAPVDTFKAFYKNNKVDILTTINPDDYPVWSENLKKSKLNLKDIYENLLHNGLKSFQKDFNNMLINLK